MKVHLPVNITSLAKQCHLRHGFLPCMGCFDLHHDGHHLHRLVDVKAQVVVLLAEVDVVGCSFTRIEINE